jgi:hypothetical protein
MAAMFQVRKDRCAALKDLELPSLKHLAWQIAKRHPTLKFSDQKIAYALRNFGIRIPASRPRK